MKTPKKEKIKAPKRKRKNEINIDKISKKTKKWRKRSKKLSVGQIVERERRKKEKTLTKHKKKATKGLVDFNNFIRDEVVEPEQKRLFNLEARNSSKKSSTAIDDEKEKAINLYNALVNNSKVFFTLQIK